MASNDFIPAPRADFDNWQNNFVKVVNTNKASWDFSPAALAEWTLLTATPGRKKLLWDEAWVVVSTKNALKSDREKLKGALREYKSGNRKNPADTSIRLFINRYIRYNPLVTNVQKKEMGLTVPDDVRSFYSGTNTEITANDLGGHVMNAHHLYQLSEVKIPGHKSRARGVGVKSIQVFIFITADLTIIQPDIHAFSFDGTVKRGKYVRVFDPEQEGMRAWYYARKVFKGKTETYGLPSTLWSGVIM